MHMARACDAKHADQIFLSLSPLDKSRDISSSQIPRKSAESGSCHTAGGKVRTVYAAQARPDMMHIHHHSCLCCFSRMHVQQATLSKAGALKRPSCYPWLHSEHRACVRGSTEGGRAKLASTTSIDAHPAAERGRPRATRHSNRGLFTLRRSYGCGNGTGTRHGRSGADGAGTAATDALQAARGCGRRQQNYATSSAGAITPILPAEEQDVLPKMIQIPSSTASETIQARAPLLHARGLRSTRSVVRPCTTAANCLLVTVCMTTRAALRTSCELWRRQRLARLDTDQQATQDIPAYMRA